MQNQPLSLFSAAYWRAARAEFRNVRVLAFSGLVCAMAVVLQSTPDSIARQRPEGFPFEVICDPDRVLYRKFEVPCAKSRMTMLSVGLPKKLSRAKSLGLQHGEYEGSELQLPALFLINNEGKLLYTRYAKTLTDLPDIEDLPNMMRMLNKKKTPLTEPR